jgi:hypothetical protein
VLRSNPTRHIGIVYGVNRNDVRCRREDSAWRPFWTSTPAALCQASLEVLAIVGYEQPVSRADVAQIRGTDSAGVIDTVLARRLVADDAPYGGRCRPAFLVTTDCLLQVMGLGSQAELPPGGCRDLTLRAGMPLPEIPVRRSAVGAADVVCRHPEAPGHGHRGHAIQGAADREPE